MGISIEKMFSLVALYSEKESYFLLYYSIRMYTPFSHFFSFNATNPFLLVKPRIQKKNLKGSIGGSITNVSENDSLKNDGDGEKLLRLKVQRIDLRGGDTMPGQRFAVWNEPGTLTNRASIFFHLPCRFFQVSRRYFSRTWYIPTAGLDLAWKS